MHIHKCSVSFAGRLIQSWPTQPKQLPCIWPYSFPPLASLMWMPALFFFLLLSCHTRRLFLDAENEAEDPVAQRGTQLAALRWVQLVGVRGSSIHAGQNWDEQRTAVAGEGGGGLAEVTGSCYYCTPVSAALVGLWCHLYFILYTYILCHCEIRIKNYG